MRFRRDIAIDITESMQPLVCFAALRSMPVMPKLGEHCNVDAMHAMAVGGCCIGHTGRCSKCASVAAPRRPVVGQAQYPKGHTCIGPPQRSRPARTHARTIARTNARPHARTRGPMRLHTVHLSAHVRTFSPQVRRRSGRRRLTPVPVGQLPIRPPGLSPLSRTRDPVPRCLGWLATHWVRARLRAPLNPPSSAPARRAPREKGR